MRDAVGLGPQGDLALVDEGLVRRREQRLAVERYREPLALGPDRESVPVVLRDLGRGTGDLRPPALDDAIEIHVVLERIRADDVIVIGCRQAGGNAARLIDL